MVPASASTAAPGVSPAAGRRQPPLPALTGLRLIAAVAVALEHFPELIPFNDGRPELVIPGGAGVGLFFVLSGFVLTYNYIDWFEHDLRRVTSFVRARLARIAPLHVIALLIITGLAIGRRDEVISLGSPITVAGAWLANLLLLHAYAPAKILHSWNGPSWSISAELFFYLLFPPLVYLWLRHQRQAATRLGWVIVGAFLIELVLFVAVHALAARALLASNPDPDGVRHLLNRFVYLPPLRVWEFIIGMALGAAFLRSRQIGAASWWRPLHDRRVRTGLVVIVAGLALMAQLLPGCLVPGCRQAPAWLAMLDFKLYVLYTPLATLLIAAVVWGPVFLNRFLEHPWVQLLGEASYAFYILQWITWSLLHGPGSDPSAQPLWLSSWAVGLTGVVAVAAFTYVETPLRRRLRG